MRKFFRCNTYKKHGGGGSVRQIYETWTPRNKCCQWDRHSCLSLVKSGSPYKMPILQALCFYGLRWDGGCTAIRSNLG